MEQEKFVYVGDNAYYFPEGVEFKLLSEVMQQIIAEQKGWA